jgi:hypothetical protein
MRSSIEGRWMTAPGAMADPERLGRFDLSSIDG